MDVLAMVVALARKLVAGRAALVAENLALRHQLTVLRRSVKRPGRTASAAHPRRLLRLLPHLPTASVAGVQCARAQAGGSA